MRYQSYYCHLNYHLTVSLYLIAKLLINNMPRQSNDEDLVTYTISKPTKGPAPVPPPIPFFEPLVYAQSENTPQLPPNFDSRDPGALFNLFFDDRVIEIIVKATNENAKYKMAKFDAGRDTQRLQADGLNKGTGVMSHLMRYWPI